ncbi:hypothetical protein GCM10027186_53660 [Micromonospora schwarzwaldensis]
MAKSAEAANAGATQQTPAQRAQSARSSRPTPAPTPPVIATSSPFRTPSPIVRPPHPPRSGTPPVAPLVIMKVAVTNRTENAVNLMIGGGRGAEWLNG